MAVRKGRIAVGPRRDPVIHSLKTGLSGRVLGQVPESFFDAFHLDELLEARRCVEEGDLKNVQPKNPILALWKKRAQGERRMRAC